MGIAEQPGMESGFTLIELGIAVAIAIILGVVALGVYASVHGRSEVYTATSNLKVLVSGIRGTWGPNPRLPGYNITSTVINTLRVPETMLSKDGKHLHSVWGGYVQVIISTNRLGFQFYYSEVSASQCAKFIGSVATIVTSALVSGQRLWRRGETPPDHQTIESACTSGDDKVSVRLYF